MSISIKTMREIWDNKEIKKRAEKKITRQKEIPQAIKKEYLDYLAVRDKSMIEIKKHLSNYLERKKYANEIFGFIEKDLGEAGFSKI